MDFGKEHLSERDIKGKRILEVGSLYVNGSYREIIEPMNPNCYVGIDIVKGFGVDIVLGVEHIKDLFSMNSFDVIVCTNTLEHILKWKQAIYNMKYVLKSGGLIFVSVPSQTVNYHGHPSDYWRFSRAEMVEIFRDFEMIIIAEDIDEPAGVVFKARKPVGWTQINSMMLGCIKPFNIWEHKTSWRKKRKRNRKVTSDKSRKASQTRCFFYANF